MQYRKRMIRKGTALLLSALLLASAMPFAVSAEEVSAKTTEYVNFRTGPGTNYSSKGVIPSGTGITVTDTSNSQWYAVRLSDGSTGYIYAEYISVSGSNTTEDGEVNAKTTADVNFRSGPGTIIIPKPLSAPAPASSSRIPAIPSGMPCALQTAPPAISMRSISASRAMSARRPHRQNQHLHLLTPKRSRLRKRRSTSISAPAPVQITALRVSFPSAPPSPSRIRAIPSGTPCASLTVPPATFTPSTFPFPAAILPKTGR